MAHFAKIGMKGKVIQVLTLDDKDMQDHEGKAVEAIGQQYLEQHNNWPAQMWIQTSYNTSRNQHSSGDNSKALRGNYAGIGYEWDEDNNIFWPKKPYPSWVQDIATASWKSPIGAEPALTAEQDSQNDARTHKWHYVWNESGQSWDLTDDLA
jgi:hypothetical protein